MNGIERVIIYSNDTDVVVYLLYYVHQFKDLGIKELWIKYGNGDSTRYIPIHKLADVMGSNIANLYLRLMYCLDVM